MTRVSFSLDDARRIGNVVRKVEEGNRDGSPLRFSPVQDAGGQTIKIITFTGGWGKSTLKTVTVDPTTATMMVSNIFASISNQSCSRKGAVAKVRGEWYLISAEGG